MDIIFISDLHGKFAAIDKLPKANALLVGGDFVTLDGEDALRNAIAIIAKKFPDFLAVSGNMDPVTHEETSAPCSESVVLTAGYCYC